MRPKDLLPGLLVAATGVGAGDLVTASLAGSELGTVIVWAALLGGALKLALNEGLARWQLATGTSLVRGWARHLGRPVLALFVLYLVLWSVAVGGALVSACGVAGQSLLPFDDAHTGRIAWGAAHAAGGLLLVRRGGFAEFERLMSVCIALMTIAVLVTAVLLRPDPGELLDGLLAPRVPTGGTGWVLGVLGGVGGTVTLLSYGYWIREHGRDDLSSLGTCRVDLGVAYGLTALFGAAMIVIGSRLHLDGSGAGVALALADQLASVLGEPGRWIFLVGFWGAVTSSLLGVLQGVPYLFADALRATRAADTHAAPRGHHPRPAPDDLPSTRAYRTFQVALALVPLPLLAVSVRQITLAYAVAGALFMPFLAATLLLMTNRIAWIGPRARSGRLANAALLITLALFAWQGTAQILERLG